MAINYRIIESPTKIFSGSAPEDTKLEDLLATYGVADGYLMKVSGELVDSDDTLAFMADLSETPELVEVNLATKVKNA